MTRIRLKTHHTYVIEIILEIMFDITRMRRKIIFGKSLDVVTVLFSLIISDKHCTLFSLTHCSPSKRQSELVNDTGARKVLRLVELPDLDADVGPDVEIHMVAAIENIFNQCLVVFLPAE